MPSRFEIAASVSTAAAASTIRPRRASPRASSSSAAALQVLVRRRLAQEDAGLIDRLVGVADRQGQRGADEPRCDLRFGGIEQPPSVDRPALSKPQTASRAVAISACDGIRSAYSALALTRIASASRYRPRPINSGA